MFPSVETFIRLRVILKAYEDLVLALHFVWPSFHFWYVETLPLRTL